MNYNLEDLWSQIPIETCVWGKNYIGRRDKRDYFTQHNARRRLLFKDLSTGT